MNMMKRQLNMENSVMDIVGIAKDVKKNKVIDKKDSIDIES